MVEQTKTAPLWKQLMGAGIGSLIALTFYGGYKLTFTHFGAYLTIPWVSPQEAPSGEVEALDASEAAQERLALRAKQIAEEFSTRKVHRANDSMMDDPVALPLLPEAEEPERAPIPEPEPEPIVEEEIEPVSEALQNVEPPTLPSSGIGMPLVTVLAFLGAIAFRFRKVLEKPLW